MADSADSDLRASSSSASSSFAFEKKAKVKAQPPNAWRRLLRIPTAKIALVVLAVIVLAAIFGPMLLPESYRELTANQFAPPSLKHPFGTDLNGRDVFFRVLAGARISLLVGIPARW